MKKDLNKFGFFDLVLFSYMFKSIMKNVGLYVCSLIYIITIFVIVFIIPYFSGVSPNQILLNPIVLSIIVFVISVLSAFLGIILFKTPVDDGTELLIVSKPLSRLEILNTKIIIFLIGTLLLSILGSIVSLFIFLNENTIPQKNLFIFLGFFVGSFISFSFFGFLSLIICLFAKKILVFISVCGLAMLFFLGTTLNSLTSTNPLKNMYIEGKEIKSRLWISKTQNNKPHITTLSNLSTTFIEDSNETLEEAWNLAKKRSNYYRNTYFDFGAQLSSFFLLIDDITYAEWLISSMEHFSTPYDIGYKKVSVLDTFKDRKYNLNIKISDSDIFQNNTINDGNQIENIPLPNLNDFNALPIVERFFTFSIDNKKRTYEQSESYIYSGKWSSNLWDSIWENFKLEYEKNKNILTLSNVYENFLNYIIKENNIKKDSFDQFSNLIINISKSALHKILEYKNDVNNKDKIDFSKLNLFNLYDISKDIDNDLMMVDLFVNYNDLITKNEKFKKFIDFLKTESGLNNINDNTKVVDIVSALKTKGENVEGSIYNKLINMSNHRLELKVLLTLLSINYPKSINKIFTFNDPNLSSFIFSTGNVPLVNLTFIDGKEPIPVSFELPFFMYRFRTNQEFYESFVKPTYDRRILMSIWIGITLVIAITSIMLYYKRDFA